MFKIVIKKILPHLITSDLKRLSMLKAKKTQVKQRNRQVLTILEYQLFIVRFEKETTFSS